MRIVITIGSAAIAAASSMQLTDKRITPTSRPNEYSVEPDNSWGQVKYFDHDER